MIGIPEERAIKIAKYIIEHKSTVRDAGKVFGVSKSTVHKDRKQNFKYDKNIIGEFYGF